MSRLNLSNLHVRPNLLSAEHYQQEMMRCSVFELRDIKKRNENLIEGIPPAKQAEWRESLFWGDSPPPPVPPAWAESIASGLSEQVRDLEERPTLEAAFECLVLARQLYHTRPDGPAKAAAAEWDRRVCVVLTRDEFRHTPDMIDQRLESVLGYRLDGPPRPTVPPPEPTAPPSRPAVRSRQPPLFPLGVDEESEVAPASPPVVRSSGATATRANESEVAPASPPVLATAAPAEAPPPTGLELPAEASPPVPGLPADAASPPAPRVEVEPPTVASVTTATTASPKPADTRPTPAVPPRPTTTLTVRDPDLKRLVQRWATLPDHVKKCVMMLVDAAEATQTTTSE